MDRPAFVPLTIGTLIWAKGRRYRITLALGLKAVLAQCVETKEFEQIPIELIRVDGGKDVPILLETPDLSDIPDEDWEVAQRRFAIIRPLVEDPFRTRAQAEEIAKANGVHVSTIYDWLRTFQESRHLSSLIPRPRGRRPGSRRLEAAVEAIVELTIRELYMTRQRASPQEVVDEVKMRCVAAQMKPPHGNTVRNRIRALPVPHVLRKRGLRDKARDEFEPIRGEFPGAGFPLAVVQIDHTPGNVILVDEISRRPIGRPWITLAIDVDSRVIVGHYVSFDSPSAVAVGLCLVRAMLPKGELLADLDVPGEWPVWGKMRTVHADNAKEFRGAMLKKACEEYAIDLNLRPVKRPHYGGHIERLMGTASNEIRKLPGTTFSSPKERKGYDSEKESALTLAEFEQHLVDFIVNIYHKREHSARGMPPIQCWKKGMLGDELRPGMGPPEVPADPTRLRLDFLPFKRCTVQRYGIRWDNVIYYHEVLNPWINARDPEDTKGKKKRLFTVRRDPRDISRVYFLDPETNEYFAIPYQDPGHPAISIWELKAAKAKLKSEPGSEVNQTSIFEAIERMRVRVDEAAGKTKAARSQQHRRKRTEKLASGKGDTPAPIKNQTVAETTPTEFDEMFASPVDAFEDVRVKP